MARSAAKRVRRFGRTVAGVVLGGAGLVAGGAAAVVAAEKLLVARMRGRQDPEIGEGFGTLRGTPCTVVTDDGVPLHVEVDGPEDAPVTIVFCHGYALDQDCWHYQRRDLTGIGRRVFYDQRSHGRSRRGRPADSTIDQLGADLHRIIEATVPPGGPIVLFGHSMGGMSILALAQQHPELFRGRVRAVALIATSGRLNQVTLGLPAFLGRAVDAAAEPVMRTLAWQPAIVDQGRRVGAELSFLTSRMLGFGAGEVSPALVDHLDEMIRRTPTDVLTEFWPALSDHDKQEAYAVLRDVPTLVVCGDRDRMTPIEHSEHIAAALPDADFVRVPDAGHMVMMERPAVVNEALRTLLARAGVRETPPAPSAGGGTPPTIDAASP
ncbi:alpha/beta fold hydrolase [Marinactinospora rubrisoli]|uniref:Alpha/beta fold hydrolase n=1 Tax=Marinactinospora rubrisoli TaxID=2715399 RepID=A0ABW2KJC2_9ACTN